MSPDVVWAGLAAAAAGIEWWQAWRSRDGVDRGTLTACVRRAFRTRTRWGRAVFAAAWTASSVWVLRHILRPGAVVV